MTSEEEGKKKGIVSLRFSILSIFLSLFIATILLLTSLTFFRAKEAMLFTASELLAEISNSILFQINEETTEVAKELTQSLQLIRQNALDVGDLYKLSAYLTSLGNRYNIVKSTYWAGEDGKIIFAETKTNDEIAVTLVDYKKDPHLINLIFFDPQRKITGKGSRYVENNYDPRLRPWYARAKAEKTIIWTDIYTFLSGAQGITWAGPVFNHDGTLKGVMGIDITLETLTYFVQQQKVGKNGFVFIIRNDGTIIAFPKSLKKNSKEELIDIKNLNNPWLLKSFQIYSKTHQESFHFNYNNENYLARYSPIPFFKLQGWIIGIIVPQNDFVGDLKKHLLWDIFISLIILLVGCLLVSHIITLIIEPIKKLVKETQYIKNFELSHSFNIHSRIKEVIILADAVRAMRLGLKSFQQYVPAGLVRQLIETGENARIGGTKKPLVILFTDIKNFTSVAESMEPNVLMEYICDYFNELAKIITKESGTIDKYIGDSIMAFWGAPLPISDPCDHAAKAALQCKKRLAELNQIWEKMGRKPLITRIGIHTGDAIVGNVGSIERLNYTALGDSINEASRLEEANKFYGTQIIVSAPVYEIIKDRFVLRKIDFIAVKGKSNVETIFELLAENKSELPFDFDLLKLHFDQGFNYYQNQQWQEAIREFNVCLQIYPEDSVAINFIKRCERYLMHPPKKWDGIWRVKE